MHAALLAIALALPANMPPPPPAELTLARIHAEPSLEGRPPTALTLSPAGRWLAWLAPSARDAEVQDLFGARLPGGPPETLVAASDLLAGAVQRLTEAERMALERRRIGRRGITAYQWCGGDGQTLLFPFSGDLYLARLPAGPPPPVPGEPQPKCLPTCGKPSIRKLTSDPEVPELNPVCSPDGRQVAFVRDGNLHVLDVGTRTVRALTATTSETQSFGLAEFIAEEEMGRHEGFWWSPDGLQLLVLEVDEAPVGVKQRARIHAERTDLVAQRYPAAGEANAVVRAWLVEADGGARLRLETPAEDGYLARAGFFPDGRPWVAWQTRDQRALHLLEHVGTSGAMRTILVEEDAAWVELHDDLRALPGGRLLWSTERSGRRQLVTVDRATGKLRALTAEPEPVERVLAVDAKGGRVFYAAWRDRGRELHVFSIPSGGGKAQQLTREPGWHDATFDATGRYFVDRHSDLMVPPRTTLRNALGTHVRDIDPNPADELRGMAMPEATALAVTAVDGTPLNAWLFKPRGTFDTEKMPVIVSMYGGPGAQTVRRAWSRSALHILRWTQLGVGVFMLDNRGMAGRDRAFTRAHHRRFGDVELEDLRAGVAALSEVPWVDAGRLGLFGWSYGGFLAARAALDPATPFAAAVAVAPVTDWTLYDTHYTERYLGLPGAPGSLAAPYAHADLVRRAADLACPLLLVHGTADDNVLFDHTLRLAAALQGAGHRFELMVYPGKAHGIAGKAAQSHVYGTLTGFLARHLAFRDPEGDAARRPGVGAGR